MSASNKIKNAATNAKGRAKEAAGAATGNRELQNEGRLDQISANLQQSVEKLRDTARSIF